MLLFNRWETESIEVRDLGLKRYINIAPVAVPKTCGRYGPDSIHKVRMNLVERFINKLAVAGHKGKKHKLSSGHAVGKYEMLMKAVMEAFDIIEKRTNRNPVEVMVRAVENGALLEEVMGYRLGGIIARKAVVTTPQRRLDISLKLLAQDIHQTAFKNRKKLPQVIADELIAVAENDQRNNVVKERSRIEKEAEGAR